MSYCHTGVQFFFGVPILICFLGLFGIDEFDVCMTQTIAVKNNKPLNDKLPRADSVQVLSDFSIAHTFTVHKTNVYLITRFTAPVGQR